MNKDDVVLISGCSSGIGLALAKEFAGQGYRVCATALEPREIEGLRAENVEVFALDVTDRQSIAACVKAAAAKWGRIDLLVNNAGYGLFGPVIELSLADVREQFETNLFGAIALTQAIVPGMLERRRGLIINISSISAVLTPPFGGAYSATKAALSALSDAMRVELAHFGIQVMTIQPGAIGTNFGHVAVKKLGRYYEKTSVYAPIAHAIEARAKSHLINPTPAEDLAKKIVRMAARDKCPGVVRMGRESFKLPLAKAILPQRLIDRILAGKYELVKLGKAFPGQ